MVGFALQYFLADMSVLGRIWAERWSYCGGHMSSGSRRDVHQRSQHDFCCKSLCLKKGSEFCSDTEYAVAEMVVAPEIFGIDAAKDDGWCGDAAKIAEVVGAEAWFKVHDLLK